MELINGGVAAAPAPVPSSGIINIVWQWETLNDVAAGTSTRVPDASKYTITFFTNGTTTGRADCNTFSGTYSQVNGFTIAVTPDVMAACDMGSSPNHPATRSHRVTPLARSEVGLTST